MLRVISHEFKNHGVELMEEEIQGFFIQNCQRGISQSVHVIC